MNKAFIILSLIALSVVAQDFSSAAYQAKSRTEKLQQLKTSIFADTSSGSYPQGAAVGKIFFESMHVTMEYDSDVFPAGREKLIHSVGNTAAVEFVAEADSPYTGLFQGADSGIIRLSAAKEADFTKTTAKEAYDNFTPGFGLKFLIDGQPSANVVSMFGVNGVDTWNFFGRDFSNHIPGASGAALTAVAQKFSSATESVQAVGLRDFSTYTQSGSKVASPKFPWRLIFRAPDALKNQYSDDFQEDFQKQLSAIPSGTALYDVFAIESPTEACLKKIGQIKLSTILTPSKFGDQQLFFKHQKMENDLAIHPENKDYTPIWSLFGNRDAKKPEGKCPYAQYFQ